MSLHAEAVRVLECWSAPGTEQEDLRLAYLRHLRTHPDAVWRSCVPDHLTASALIVSADLTSVLLTLHTKVGRWLQTGGHCEPGDPDLAAAALREAREESGIADLRLASAPVLLSRHQVPCGPQRPAHHLDVQYAVTAPPGARPERSEESLELAWFATDALPADADESVRSLVRACCARLSQVR